MWAVLYSCPENVSEGGRQDQEGAQRGSKAPEYSISHPSWHMRGCLSCYFSVNCIYMLCIGLNA